MTTFSSLSDLVNITPMFTPTQFSQHHRIFRCLGLAGPPVLFSLNPSAGPTRQSHCCSSLSRNCRPAPVPVRRSAAARAPPARHSKPPPRPSSSLRHRTRSPTLAHAAPAPLLRSHSRAQAAPVPPTRRRSPPPSASLQAPASLLHSTAPLLLPRTSFQARFEVLCTLDSVHTRCSRNCHLGHFRRFRPYFARVCLHTLKHVLYLSFLILDTHVHI